MTRLGEILLPAGLARLYSPKGSNNGKEDRKKAARDSFSNLIKMHSMSLPELLKAAWSGGSLKKSKELESYLEIDFAKTNLNEDQKKSLGLLARQALANIAVREATTFSTAQDQKKAVHALAELFDPQVPLDHLIYGDTPQDRSAAAAELYLHVAGSNFEIEELNELLARSFVEQDRPRTEFLLRRMAFGPYGNLEKVDQMSQNLYRHTLVPKLLFLLPLTALLLLINVLFINANSTSLHAFYRDRLANAFKIMPRGETDVTSEFGVLLSDLSDYDSGSSIVPYHLFNAAINMCHSGHAEIRNRNADFFVFSKLYVGGEYTDYVETKNFQCYAPEFTVASAMAISGAAASANMGKYSNGILTFFLSILNVRLGYWIPNPSFVGNKVAFGEVFSKEIKLIEKRRNQLQNEIAVLKSSSGRTQSAARKISDSTEPTVDHKLLGLALSGGGIRSAALNLGILQALEDCELFKEVDYLSSVSGGGYTASAISSFMRRKENDSSIPAIQDEDRSENEVDQSQQVADCEGELPIREAVKKLNHRFSWMPKSWLLVSEMFSRVNDRSKWVNVSDGGHIENLGVYELLRRRCKVIIVGDGEADPSGCFDGLSCLMRLAEIDMGVRVEFPDGSLEFAKSGSKSESENLDCCTNRIRIDSCYPPHFAIGKVLYPSLSGEKEEVGYILYLKSCFQGNEDQVIKNYKQVNPAFPHESTVDQMFDEGQFEAYRRLGVFIAKEAERYVFGRSKKRDFQSLETALKKSFERMHSTKENEAE